LIHYQKYYLHFEHLEALHLCSVYCFLHAYIIYELKTQINLADIKDNQSVCNLVNKQSAIREKHGWDMYLYENRIFNFSSNLYLVYRYIQLNMLKVYRTTG